MEKLKELLKEKPWLVWVGGGILVGLLILVMRGRSSGSAPSPVTDGVLSPGPVSGGGSPVTGDTESTSDSILSTLVDLEQQQASFQAQSLALQQQQYERMAQSTAGLSEAFAQSVTAAVTPVQSQVSGLQANVSGLQSEVTDLAASVANLATSTVKGAAQSFSFAGYDAATGESTPTTVTVDNPYEAGIAAAKVKYATATTDDERAAAHAEADRYRQAAKDAGVTLDEELRSGDTIHPGATSGATPI